MNTHIAGYPTVGQLHQLLNKEEKNSIRRSRLFERFGGPRAHVVNQLTNLVLSFIAEEWQDLNNALVLDYGCGVMPYSKAFEYACSFLIGADIGKNDYANLQIQPSGNLPIASNSFDFVVSFQVLEHVQYPQEYISEASRILKTGGKIFLTTHGVWPYHPTPTDYHRWTVDGLRYELEKGGFSIKYTKNILNEYSAFVQNFVTSADYRNTWKLFRGFVNLFAYFVIIILEYLGNHQPQTPAIICVLGEKK